MVNKRNFFSVGDNDEGIGEHVSFSGEFKAKRGCEDFKVWK